MSAQSRPGPGDRGRGVLRRSLVRGTALVIPLAVTLLVLKVLLGFLLGTLAPVVEVVELVFGLRELPAAVVQAGTAATLLAVVVVLGYAAERREGTSHALTDDFDQFMAAIPGIGGLYTGFRRVSQVLLDADTDSFRDVKLVEFPREETYMLGFTTAEPPETVREAAGHEEMRTLFLPLAPNPVMGGFLVNVPRDRVRDVDLSVEEGVTAVMTSGAAVDAAVDDVPDGDLRDHLPDGYDEGLLADLGGTPTAEADARDDPATGTDSADDPADETGGTGDSAADERRSEADPDG